MDESIECAVNRAIDTMRDNLGEQLTVDDIARAALFSKFHFTRIFQRATGVSPGRFLSALRLERAKYLLVTTSLNIADISLRVGYNSVGTFSSRFTRSIGMSPTAYRRRTGFASHIPVEPRCPHAAPSAARVYGEVRLGPGQPEGLVFVGLFPQRIPEGRPVRCTVLAGPGRFDFDAVPPGMWYLLAQTGAPDGSEPAGEPDHRIGRGRPEPPTPSRRVWLATHGPLWIEHDTVLRMDPVFAPARDLDPPVLMALLDSRMLALAAVADQAGQTTAVAAPTSAAHAVTELRPAARSAPPVEHSSPVKRDAA